MELPSGSRTLEDQTIIDHLLKDEIFLATMTESMGTIVRMWADWPADRIYYQLLNGDFKESKLSKILVKLREIGYMKEFEN